MYCEAGEHNTSAANMWPNFNDCHDCATPKEYAEHMGISVKEAWRIAGFEPEVLLARIVDLF